MEARETTQAPAPTDLELLPLGCGEDGVANVEMLQQWQLLEAYLLEARELVRARRRMMAIVVKYCLQVVAEEDVERYEAWQLSHLA